MSTSVVTSSLQAASRWFGAISWEGTSRLVAARAASRTTNSLLLDSLALMGVHIAFSTVNERKR